MSSQRKTAGARPSVIVSTAIFMFGHSALANPNAPPPEERSSWAVEFAAGIGLPSDDSYIQDLVALGFEEPWSSLGLRGYLALTHQISERFTIVGHITNLDSRTYSRQTTSESGLDIEKQLSWTSYAMGLSLRGAVVTFEEWMDLHLQAGVGPAIGYSTFDNGTGASSETSVEWGYHLTAGGGLGIMPVPHLGLYIQALMTFAPIDSQLSSESHNNGGITGFIGLRATL